MFKNWQEAGHNYIMRIRRVEESSTNEGVVTTITLEGPIYRGSEIVPSQHTYAELMVFFPRTAMLKLRTLWHALWSLTLFYPSAHALKMAQVEKSPLWRPLPLFYDIEKLRLHGEE